MSNGTIALTTFRATYLIHSPSTSLATASFATEMPPHRIHTRHHQQFHQYQVHTISACNVDCPHTALVARFFSFMPLTYNNNKVKLLGDVDSTLHKYCTDILDDVGKTTLGRMKTLKAAITRKMPSELKTAGFVSGLGSHSSISTAVPK